MTRASGPDTKRSRVKAPPPLTQFKGLRICVRVCVRAQRYTEWLSARRSCPLESNGGADSLALAQSAKSTETASVCIVRGR